MRICSISDTHGIHPDFLSYCDILTISGDVSPCTREYNGVIMQRQYFFESFIPFFKDKAKHIIFIAGNHDKFLERIMKDGKEEEFRSELPSNFYYLRDSSIVIDGIHFYGTPWTTPFGNWSFMKSDDDEGLGNKFKDIPMNVDYLLSHGPVYGYNDIVEIPIHPLSTGQSLGSKMLLKHIKRAKPRNVMVGHIHTGSHNVSKILLSEGNSIEETCDSVNVSILDEGCNPFYKNICTKNI